MIKLQTNLVSGDDASSVILKQESWNSNGNITTRMDVLNSISDFIFNTDNFESSCEMLEENEYNSIVYAYPNPDTLSFNVGLTHGVHAEGVMELATIESLELVSFDISIELDYPLHSDFVLEWITDCYDKNGSLVSKPTYAIVGNSIVFSKEVYGSIRITYVSKRFIYALNVPAREEATENYFQSVFYAYWDGGVVMLKLTAPKDADEDYKLDVSCKGGSIVIVEDDPQLPPVEGFPVHDSVSVDYCTQEERDGV